MKFARLYEEWTNCYCMFEEKGLLTYFVENQSVKLVQTICTPDNYAFSFGCIMLYSCMCLFSENFSINILFNVPWLSKLFSWVDVVDLIISSSSTLNPSLFIFLIAKPESSSAYKLWQFLAVFENETAVSSKVKRGQHLWISDVDDQQRDSQKNLPEKV